MTTCVMLALVKVCFCKNIAVLQGMYAVIIIVLSTAELTYMSRPLMVIMCDGTINSLDMNFLLVAQENHVSIPYHFQDICTFTAQVTARDLQ